MLNVLQSGGVGGGHLLPSWNRASSRAVLSSTVRAVTVMGPLARLGKQPCSRTSCQSEWILQMSTESKNLRRENNRARVDVHMEDSHVDLCYPKATPRSG